MFKKGHVTSEESKSFISEYEKLKEEVFYSYPERINGYNLGYSSLRATYDTLRMKRPNSGRLSIEWLNELNLLKHKTILEEWTRPCKFCLELWNSSSAALTSEQLIRESARGN